MLAIKILITIGILGLVSYSGWAGYRRGFVAVATDLLGFLLSALVATLSYARLGSFMSARLKVVPSFAAVAAFLLVLLFMQILYLLALRRLPKIPRHIVRSPINRWAGLAINAVRALLMITVALIVFTTLPLRASQKNTVISAPLPKTLLAYSGQLQQAVSGLLGDAITDTLNFITVKSGSHENIKLGFATTDVVGDESAEADMLRMVNKERTSRGLKSLRLNTLAQRVARAHSRDMFARGYFSHVDPDGHDPFQRMDAGGVKYSAAGENLALAPTLQLAHSGLMNSPGHKANILSPEFGTVGIGVIDGGRYGLMITQNFTN